MRLILLINFINELLNLTEEELTRLNHYLEGLLNLEQGKEVKLLMGQEKEENIILPEGIDDQEILAEEINNDTVATEDDIDATLEEESNSADSDNDLEEEKTEATNKGVVNQLQGIKTELKDFKEEVIKQNLLKGGDKMSEEKIKAQCGGRNNRAPGQERFGGCCPTIIEEVDLPDLSQPITKPVSCIKVVHENLFDKYSCFNPYPNENFMINKLNCCFERVLIRSERTDCCYPGIILRACGCVEYGVYTRATTRPSGREKEQLDTAELKERGIEIAYICCENCICIDEIVWWDCWTCDAPPEEERNLTQNNNGCVITPSINWEKATPLSETIELINSDTTCDCSVTPPQIVDATELNLANKAAVVFEGTLTLAPPF